MFDSRLEQLLKNRLPSLPQVLLERSLELDIDELVSAVLPPMKLAVVDDEHISDVCGGKIFRALKSRYASTHITLPGRPMADEETARYLRMQTLSCDALIAVGSGTINDLCKYVAHLDGKPYIVFPTAASMNGYLSANASIARGDYKTSVAAQMPKAVFCDLSVLAAAPLRLSKSGLGDSMARFTAQADWLLSHLLLGTHYEEFPFLLTQPFEQELFEQARGIALGDFSSMTLLMKTLLASGLGMTVVGGSHPASQGEHMIAHAMEMMKNKVYKAPQTFHGEEIGVTTLTMVKRQEQLLRGKPRLLPDKFDEERMTAVFGGEVVTEAKKAFTAKQAMVKHQVVNNWEVLAEKIGKVTVGVDKLQSVLKAAQAPMLPEDLKWHEEDYKIAVASARFLRDRFTFLDLSPG